VSSDLVLRPLAPGEQDAAMGVHLAARRQAEQGGTMPAGVHTADEGLRWFREQVVPHREVWVGTEPRAAASEVVAVLVLDEAFLDQLYVEPGHQGRGIGSALLELATSLRPGGFCLWVFEVNRPAIRLYERHGLRLVESTDGAGNEEGAPDRRYCWDGAGSSGADTAVGPAPR